MHALAKSPAGTNLLNIGLYQLGWFCCVLGAAYDVPNLGAICALLLVGLHLLLATSRQAEAALMLGACLLGVSLDSLQQALGLFTFKSNPAWPLWIPLWVFVIWAQFATLLHYALHWLAGRYLLAALCGLFGGPLAYWAGVRLGAAAFGSSPLLSVAVLGTVWAGLMPGLVWLAERTAKGRGRYAWPRNSQETADEIDS